MRSFVAVTLTVLITLSSVPAHALRQVGLEEGSASDRQLLADSIGVPPEVLSHGNRGNFPLGRIISSASGLEENLDALLEQARSSSPEDRRSAAERLGRWFDGVTVRRTEIVSFAEAPGGGHVRARRVLPDLTPVTALGAIAVLKQGVIGSKDKNAVDLASASHMRPAIERLFRIVGWNWQNLSGEGRRDGVSDRAQIPPMENPIIFSPGWPTLYTANDPVDATTRTSRGQDGGVVLFTETPQFGQMLPDELRVENVVYAGQPARFSLRHDAYNVIFQRIAAANDRNPSDYEIWVLNRPHHQAIIEAARQLGAKVRIYQDGTVQPVLYLAAFPDKPIIVAGRVGATEGKMIAAPLRNVEYPDGGRVWLRGRLISENSGYEVEEKRAPDGSAYYIPRVGGDGQKVVSKSLHNGNKLGLTEIRALRDAGYSDEQIDAIRDGSWEFDLNDLAPAAGDGFLTYITDPMTDIDGAPLYDWGVPIQGVHVEGGEVVTDSLEFVADGVRIVQHRCPDRPLGVIANQLQDHEEVVGTLRDVVSRDPDATVQDAARQALQSYLPHALSRDFQKQAALGMAGLAGLEEGEQVTTEQLQEFFWNTQDNQPPVDAVGGIIIPALTPYVAGTLHLWLATSDLKSQLPNSITEDPRVKIHVWDGKSPIPTESGHIILGLVSPSAVQPQLAEAHPPVIWFQFVSQVAGVTLDSLWSLAYHPTALAQNIEIIWVPASAKALQIEDRQSDFFGYYV